MPKDLLMAGAASAGGPSANLLPAVVPLLVLIVALDVYCLVNLARAKSVRNVPKFVWVIVILFVSAPIGALIYLFIGRDRGQDAVRRRRRGRKRRAGQRWSRRHRGSAAAWRGAARGAGAEPLGERPAGEARTPGGPATRAASRS